MTYNDRPLKCADCENEFLFTAGEQAFYQERGFQNDPKRCQACRVVRASDMAGRRESAGTSPTGRGGGAYSGARQARKMFPVVCAECGRNTEVPFEPKGTKPVYCSECFNRQRADSPDRQWQ